MKLFLCVLSTILVLFDFANSRPDRIIGLGDNNSNLYISTWATPSNLSFLDSIFSSQSIPTAGIIVLENALGDVVHDSVINILDLLRLRDITIVRPPTPSPYELGKGDLSHDGKIDAQDLNILRDILLYKASVPYLVDSTGGKVLGDGITLTLPSGAVDSTIVIYIQRNSESEFANDMGVDTKGAVQDSAYFMASFEITSSTLDFKLPVNATIKLDSIPPCAYQGLNGLFAAVPDRDGDGRTELFLINELNVSSDSLTLTAGDIAVPSIQSLSVSSIEPGLPMIITGHGFGNDVENIFIHFQSTLTDTFRVALPTTTDDSTIFFTVSDIPQGQFQLTVRNVLTGLISNAIPIEISSYSSVVDDIRTTIVNFYSNLAMSIDSVNDDDLVSAIEDTAIRNHYHNLMQAERAFVDSGIIYFSTLADSLLEGWRSFGTFIQNLNQSALIGKEYRNVSLSHSAECQPCIPYRKRLNQMANDILALTKRYNKEAADCAMLRFANPPFCEPCIAAERIRKQVLSNTDIEALLANLYNDCVCRNCGGSNCDKCDRTTFIGFGPQGKKISGGYSGNGFSTTGCCINIIRYKRNICTVIPQYFRGNGSPVPIDQHPGLSCPPTLMFQNVFRVSSELDTRAHPGSIIKVTNAQVPYNIVGILNDNGNAFIPQVPMNTKIIFSTYDPVTGLYDPNVGTYTTGSTPGGFDRPILLFQPTTEIRRIAMRIGETKHDSVSLDWQRIDYLLNVTAIDTGKMINVGFEANALLSVRLEGPQGSVLLDNNNTDCYYYPRVRLDQVGTYTLRVSYGVSAQAGSFIVGVDYYPKSPIGTWFLCDGFIVDTLYEELSPYLIEDPLAISPGDTVVVEHGVYLLFEHGGSVTSNGTLMGNGSSAKPIKLKHAGTAKRELATIKEPVSGRKEVEP